MFRIVVFISGRGSNFKAIADAISKHGLPIEIAAVISDKANATGLETAKELGIPSSVVSRRVKELSKDQFINELKATAESYRPDLLVLAGFMRVLSEDFVNHFYGRLINIHPSLLPAFPGLHCHQRAIDAKVSHSGCTVHYVSPEVDCGPIIAQASVEISADDDADSLAAKILTQEHQLYPAVLAGIASGKINLSNSNEVLIDSSISDAETNVKFLEEI